MRYQDWISRKIRLLLEEGYPERQAVAIAFSMARQKQARRKARGR